MTKIKDFQEKMRLKEPLMIKEVKNGTTAKGLPYLTLTLSDDTGMIDGKFWDVKPTDEELIYVGEVAMVSFEVLDYKGALQLRINHVERLDQNTVDLSSYVASSEQSKDEREQKLGRYVNMISDHVLQELVRGMLAKVYDRYLTYPAASKIHHNFIGGLSEHSLSMAEMCMTIADHYPQLNRDLLLAGALVHDVGKTVEMSGPISTEYTLAGRLEGHISIANGILTEVAEAKGYEGSEQAVLLHHMILSHHGHYEFGSPVLPQVQEAEVLSLVDNLDARMNTLRQALDGIKPGTWTTRMFALENRAFYKPVLQREEENGSETWHS